MKRSRWIFADKPTHPRHPFDDLEERIWDDDSGSGWWVLPATVIGLVVLAALVWWGR